MHRKLELFINHRYTDIFVIILILVSITLLVLETILDELKLYHYCLWCLIVNDVITILFIIELSIRYITFRKKKRFFKSYWIDILAVLPILRPFRILRVLRLLRIFRMGLLLNRRISSVSALFREGLNEYLIVFLIIVMLVLSGAIGIRILEGNNKDFGTFDQSFWWSILSMIAGEPIYGTPETMAGKVITLVIMLGGLTLFAVFTGVVSAVMVQKLRGGIEVKEMELDELRNHVIICGWNRSASMIIEEIQTDKEYRHKPIVLIAEFNEDPPLPYEHINKALLYIVKEDYTQIDVLKRVRVDMADIAILLPDKTKPRSDQDRDARTVLAALIIEKLNKNIFTCVELLNRDNETHLQMAGVEEVIVGDEYAGNIIAAAAKNFGIITVLNELFTSKYGNQFFKLAIPETWIGKTALELFIWLKKNYNALLLSIERPGDSHRTEVKVNPSNDYVFREDDKIIIVARQRVTLT
ncbi:ion transporter [candidate division CSSED10-310 bacterium]|uniref:BK channel n=1 Tax=candidate division CSSED10-310 bacterium TaxID=2855610 RepID=A0ABV6Z0N4_UNCC1